MLMSVAPRWGISAFAWLIFSTAIGGLGLGAINPAASNAGLHLAPDQVASITGLRAMFINLGVITSVSVTTAILNRSADPAMAQAHVFWAASALAVFVILPLATRIPEHRGAW
jgi:MFS family permease